MADDKDKKVVASGMGGLGFIIVLLILFSLWINNNNLDKTDSKTVSSKPVTSSLSQNDKTTTTTNRDEKAEGESNYSPYRGQINLSAGSGKSTYQPNQEYIILTARGNKNPINIGGWTLKNGRDKQMYVVSGNTVRGQSVFVKIPNLGVVLYDPYHPQNNRQTLITLKSGERAIITTGRSTVLNGAKIKDNFKINRCLGYLEDGSGYHAYPSLKYNCPSSNDVLGISYLDNTCYDFARSIRTCHTPEDIYVRDNEGYCLEGNCKLTSVCRDFVKKNYNFDTCFATYSQDKDFIGPEWRIFLNQNFELWADRRETISLYDRAGLLVTELSY